eukprot:UN32149
MVRLYGKSLKINKAARDRKEMDVGANIFVGNLEEEVDDQLLYNAFSVFGQVLAAKVMYDPDGKHRGFGFVNFADFDAADTAITHMSGQFLCNRAIHVSYAYKEGRRERHGSYEERYMAKRMQARYAKPPNMNFSSASGQNNQIQGGTMPLVVQQPNEPQQQQQPPQQQQNTMPPPPPPRQIPQAPINMGVPPPAPFPQQLPPPPIQPNILGMPPPAFPHQFAPPPPPMGMGGMMNLPPAPPQFQQMGGNMMRPPPVPQGGPGMRPPPRQMQQ